MFEDSFDLCKDINGSRKYAVRKEGREERRKGGEEGEKKKERKKRSIWCDTKIIYELSIHCSRLETVW